ncbi:TIM-barrel domain-containing protein, partial [Terriglobus sp. YAF25]
MFQFERHYGDAIFVSGTHRLRLRFPTEATVRVTYTEDSAFAERTSAIVIAREDVSFNIAEEQELYRLSTNAIEVLIAKASGALTVADSRGKVLLKEPGRGGKWLTRKKVYRSFFSATQSIATDQSIDGARAAAESFETLFDREAFEAKLEFSFADDEALYGLGSHEEGYGNLRGRYRELYQQNMKAVVPVLISSRGYGVLLDCESLMTFHDDALGSYWWAETVAELDYYIFSGDTLEKLYGQYYALTGQPTMLPKWALGYVQSKERYVNAEELLDVAGEYRRREIPLDCIVLDWKSWPNGSGWGQKSFDPIRFPDPSGMTKALHDMDVRLMASIWPIMTGGCDNQIELQQNGQVLGNQSTYNAFDDEARATYWRQAKRGLFDHGVDAWWCDCTEP